MKNILGFLPLLVFYSFIVLVASTNNFQGDEGHYVYYANNLSHGYYSPPGEIDLWRGPGYPIVLTPFILLKIPWLAAKLLNTVFLFGTVIYFYYALSLYIPQKPSQYFSYLLGIYPPLMRVAHLLYSESLTFFLVGGFLFYFCKVHKMEKIRWNLLLIASGFLGYLAITKIFFGYVILAGLLYSLLFYLWKKWNTFKITLMVYSFSLLFCLPYLFYTYSLTGKVFYWATSGGSSLYWMSTPYENELGDWHNPKTFGNNQGIAKKHGDFFDKISNLNMVQYDEELKKQAIFNITHYPKKYFKNWIANVGRLLFSYPFSYTPQKISTYFFFIPNMFIVVFFLLCIFPSFVRRKLIPYEIWALLLFGSIAFIGSSFLSAYARQFYILVPIFGLYISFILTRVLKIEIRM